VNTANVLEVPWGIDMERLRKSERLKFSWRLPVFTNGFSVRIMLGNGIKKVNGLFSIRPPLILTAVHAGYLLRGARATDLKHG
jgi:hypothetical protein